MTPAQMMERIKSNENKLLDMQVAIENILEEINQDVRALKNEYGESFIYKNNLYVVHAKSKGMVIPGNSWRLATAQNYLFIPLDAEEMDSERKRV